MQKDIKQQKKDIKRLFALMEHFDFRLQQNEENLRDVKTQTNYLDDCIDDLRHLYFSKKRFKIDLQKTALYFVIFSSIVYIVSQIAKIF